MRKRKLTRLELMKRYRQGCAHPRRGRARRVGKVTDKWVRSLPRARRMWAIGFAPYAAALRTLKLPRRGPTGSPENAERYRLVCVAMLETKAGMRAQVVKV